MREDITDYGGLPGMAWMKKESSDPVPLTPEFLAIQERFKAASPQINADVQALKEATQKKLHRSVLDIP